MDRDILFKEQERLKDGWTQNDEKEIDDAIGQLLQHAHGRRLLYWLLEIGKAIGINPFTGNALTTAFACGEQGVGQQVMVRILDKHPNGFMTMLKERANERHSRDASLGSISTGTDNSSDRDDEGGDGYIDN